MDVIVAGAARWGLPAVLVLALSWMESELNPEAINPAGTAFGAFQVEAGTHGGPPGRWQGVGGARAAIDLMGARWVRAYHAAGGVVAWEADPAGFLCRWMPAAQGSEQPSAGRCAEAIAQAAAVYEDRQAQLAAFARAAALVPE